MTDASPALAIDGLSVAFGPRHGRLQVVENASLHVARGELVALVGESGSGKSATALAITRLLGPNATISVERIAVAGEDLTHFDARQMRAVRGRRIGFVFQEPMSSLNPLLKVGIQVAESPVAHLRLSPRAARERSIELLRAVGMPSPETRVDLYPHQLSGGQRQRVMIAIAIACDPPLLVADEPTTALDVTTQAQVLALLDQLRRERGMGILMITHDLGLVHEVADRAAVMYAGRIVEAGVTKEIFTTPRHPYTALLLEALPRVSRRVDRLPAIAGAPPSPAAFPSGCRFHPRCPRATDICSGQVPALVTSEGRSVACHHPLTSAVDVAA